MPSTLPLQEKAQKKLVAYKPKPIVHKPESIAQSSLPQEEAHKKPIITYANRAGIQLWGRKAWSDLIGNRCSPGVGTLLTLNGGGYLCSC